MMTWGDIEKAKNRTVIAQTEPHTRAHAERIVVLEDKQGHTHAILERMRPDAMGKLAWVAVKHEEHSYQQLVDLSSEMVKALAEAVANKG